MKILWNPAEARLRVGWRLAAQTTLMVLLGLIPIVAIAEPLTWMHRNGWFLAGLGKERYDHVINMIVGPFLALAVIGSIAIAGRWLDKRPFATFGARLDRTGLAGLAFGVSLGALMMGFVFSFEIALGWIAIDGWWVRHDAAIGPALALSFTAMKGICVATYEEFVSRGYHLRNLTEAFGPAWGIAGSSILFAALHGLNDNVSVAAILGILLSGVLLALAVRWTGSLTTAIGLHFAWNFFEGAVFGFPVSGDLESASIVGVWQMGPPLWTGGPFGPEAGLVGVPATLVGIAALLAWPRAAKRGR